MTCTCLIASDDPYRNPPARAAYDDPYGLPPRPEEVSLIFPLAFSTIIDRFISNRRSDRMP